MSAINRVPYARVNRKYQRAMIELKEIKSQLEDQTRRKEAAERIVRGLRTDINRLQDRIDKQNCENYNNQYSQRKAYKDLQHDYHMLEREYSKQESMLFVRLLKSLSIGIVLGMITSFIWVRHDVLF